LHATKVPSSGRQQKPEIGNGRYHLGNGKSGRGNGNYSQTLKTEADKATPETGFEVWPYAIRK
jgi:hypothetical protein